MDSLMIKSRIKEIEDIQLYAGKATRKLSTGFFEKNRDVLSDDVPESETEARIRHSHKMEAIGSLAGGIAHEFNNTLSVIIGYGKLLQKKIPHNFPEKQYVDNLLSTAEKSVTLTKSLLRFSRKEKTGDLIPAELNKTILNTESILSRLLTDNISLDISLPGESPVVLAAEGQMEQVIINLTTNARDAMQSGGTLTVSVGLSPLDKKFNAGREFMDNSIYALLSVTDTGTGMKPEIKEKIFEPFFTTKEAGVGTGMGLSIVCEIINNHNGYIDVISSRNRGTTFNIYIPLLSDNLIADEMETADS